MKKIFVVCVQAGKEKGMGEGSLFLIGNNGETVKVNAKFALANGVDENFTGLLYYDSEFHKKGAKYTNSDGVEAVYAGDFNKVTRLVPVKSNAMNTEYAKALVRKELFATAEEV